jgi:phosphopantothenate---cysteine ligase (CTP)
MLQNRLLMNCIVTAGPTYEELDEVRRLTNSSTGTLGSQLTRYLVQRGHQVQLLLGHYSTCRMESQAQRQQVFTTTADLRLRLEALRAAPVDAVFHAAAVSDFTFGKVWIRSAEGKLEEVRSPKISTRGEMALAELQPTPKILAQLRRWFPKALLVGWKFELEGDRARAIAQGERQIAENQTDFCVVNGRAYGEGFGLVRGLGQCAHFPDGPALFVALEELLTAAPIHKPGSSAARTPRSPSA